MQGFHEATRFGYARSLMIAMFLSAAISTVGDGKACSDLILPVDPVASDPAVVSARTLDFPRVDSRIFEVTMVAFERDRNWASGPSWNPGKTWQNRYGFVGLTALEWFSKLIPFGTGPFNMDGLNEHGLSAAFLWLEGSFYPIYRGGARGLLFADTVNYILGNFVTVDEVYAALSNSEHPDHVEIGGNRLFSKQIPLHLIVHDAAGRSLLIEWIDGRRNLYVGEEIDPIGVVTNEPPWPEMVALLDDPAIQDAHPNNSMEGLRGDVTPASRFTKLFKLKEFVELRGKDHVQVATHLINNVDVPHFRNTANSEDSDQLAGDHSYTGPTWIRDHRELKIYFKGQNNQSLRVVDLAKIDFDRAGLSRHGILADPKPGDRFHEDYVVAQDVTDLLGSSRFKIMSAD